ncbi:ricin-type beta-trefoil lectin domain protein [Actinacidiphila sp. bgisy160]|uniref:RICIN domain-containing protein n=1 Tax=Actinacidiphila sp. bgisy160 TaxID=3413796 RepID=UPI003D70FB96
MKESPHPNSAHPGRLFRVPDEALSGEIGKSLGKEGAHQPFEELLARHWRPVSEYAELCTVSGHAAGILAAAAFTRVFVDTLRLTGPTAAWRPELLITVHKIAEEWAVDRRRAWLHRRLRPRPDQSDTRLAVPENRRLANRAFMRLPEPARCLLWHAEVDAEPLDVPAGLLGIDPGRAAAQLELARTRFREACVQAHRDLAPYEACLPFSRLLDISIHRGGAGLVPDLQRHIARCDHCRYAAEQLDHSGDRLGVLIAEAVLVWEARGYYDSRPTRRAARDNDAGSGSGGPPGRRRGGRRRRATAGGRRRLAATLLGIGGCAVVTALAIGLTGGDGGTDDRASGTAPTTATASPTASASVTASDSAPGSGTVTAEPVPGDGLRGRLRNNDNDLCIDLSGRRTVLGTEAATARCDSGATQFWSYEPDGLMRSVAQPAYCLNSHHGPALELGLCTASFVTGAEDVRYDLTLTGDLIPRWNQQLAVAPAGRGPGAEVVLRPRDGRPVQRWTFDTSIAPPRFQSVAYTTDAQLLAGSTRVAALPSVPPSQTPSAEVSPTSGEDPCDGYCGGGGRGGWRHGGWDGWGDRDGARP